MFKQVSIKLTLLGYFILVVSIVSITIIYLQYQFSTEQANFNILQKKSVLSSATKKKT